MADRYPRGPSASRPHSEVRQSPGQLPASASRPGCRENSGSTVYSASPLPWYTGHNHNSSCYTLLIHDIPLYLPACYQRCAASPLWVEPRRPAHFPPPVSAVYSVLAARAAAGPPRRPPPAARRGRGGGSRPAAPPPAGPPPGREACTAGSWVCSDSFQI